MSDKKDVRICPECGCVIDRIDKQFTLIEYLQEELDHRTDVEGKAVRLISEGKFTDAIVLLKSLDDSTITRM